MTHWNTDFYPDAILHKGTKRLRRGDAGTCRLTRLYRDEDGAIVMFTLFALLMMLIAGGIAIDVMRQEMNRARLQNTLDTAVLAAAGAPYGVDAKAMVEDYMNKNGMSEYLDDIDNDGENDDDDVVQTLNTSKVTARAHMSMDTLLMHLSGVKQLGAVAASSAERRVPKLEVAMVLDVSGSMGSNNKLENLKVAGKRFISTILDGSDPGDAVISIIPFSWDVTPGLEIYNALNVDTRQNYSTCLQFTDADFETAGIDPTVQQTQLIYTAANENRFDDLQSSTRTCYTDDYAEIMPFSISETALQNKIDSFQASGNTSGNMGMKWAGALLDPNFQSVKTTLGTVVVGAEDVYDENGDQVWDENGEPVTAPIYMVDPRVGEVPAAYDEGETMKVIVMMGDGQNTYSNQFPLDSDFRGPDSFLHEVTWEQQEFQYAYRKNKRSRTSNQESRCSNDKWECVYESTLESAYYLYDPARDRYLNLKENETISAYAFEHLDENLDGFKSSVQLSWEEAWGKMSPDYLEDRFDYSTAKNEFQSYSNRVQGEEKDTQMANVCTAIKGKHVVIYTIGFEIDAGGNAETQLKNCASAPEYYYRAEGISITDAFNSIATNVVNLRLTQ